MGSSISTLITPFIKVNGVKTITEVKVKRICPKHPTIKYTNEKFCSQCGALIINEDVSKQVKLTPRELFYKNEEFEDTLYTPEYCDVFLPNDTPPDSVYIGENGGDVNLLERPAMMEQQLHWFHHTYSKQIALFQREFGEGNVIVGWGVVSYWS